MDDLALKFLLIGLALVFALFTAIGVLIYFWQRHKRRRIHIEKVTAASETFGSPTSYTKTASINHFAVPVETNANANSNVNGNNRQHRNSVDAFAQFFQGSPAYPRKSFEAPLPPSPEQEKIQALQKAPNGAAALTQFHASDYLDLLRKGDGGKNNEDDGHLKSVVVVKDSEDSGGDKVLEKTKNEGSGSNGGISPRSEETRKLEDSLGASGTSASTTEEEDSEEEMFRGAQYQQQYPHPQKLSLKNRPFKLSLSDVPENEAVRPPSAEPRRDNFLKGLPKNSPLTMRKFPSSQRTEKGPESDNDRLFHEFQVLNQEAQSTIRPRTTTAELTDNIRKNRFYDILPYDFNRVKLRNGKSGDYYINASYMNTDDGLLTYIAAQGPIGEPEASGGRRMNTVVDFWQMVWQESVDCIVMLTQCVEDIRQKCAMYWPENPGEDVCINEDLTMNLYCVTEDEICFQREIWLQRAGYPKRKVMQWHYKAWRDSARPEDAENLLSFMDSIRSSSRRRPMVVHCSAGVGRTGVFIALDILLDKLAKDSLIDVFETVKRLRSLRTSMVQTGEQYITVYEVIALAIRRRSRSCG